MQHKKCANTASQLKMSVDTHKKNERVRKNKLMSFSSLFAPRSILLLRYIMDFLMSGCSHISCAQGFAALLWLRWQFPWELPPPPPLCNIDCIKVPSIHLRQPSSSSWTTSLSLSFVLNHETRRKKGRKEVNEEIQQLDILFSTQVP